MNESLVIRAAKRNGTYEGVDGVVRLDEDWDLQIPAVVETIREVAAWLREYRGDEVTAKILEEEADA